MTDKPESDVWIDVHEMSESMVPFCKSSSIAMPQYGSSTQLACQFNLTAYIKHMIEQSKGK